MDAFGLFSSCLFSGYSIIWAGGNVKSAANGAFLIVTSIYCNNTTHQYIFNGIAVIKNGASATVGVMGGRGDTITPSGLSIAYSGSTVTIDIGGGPDGGWCGFIIA